MAQSKFEGDFYVTGDLSSKTFSPPAGSITNTAIRANAGVSATKLEHRFQSVVAQPNAAAVDETRVVHVVYGATGSIVAFSAGSIAKAVGDATCTVDLKVNGSSVLSAPIALDNANTNRVAEAGTVSTPALVAGDVLEVVIDGTIGTGTLPTGVFAQVTLTETGL
jgi:hypothetical protein